jgi:hypothetical protein
MDTLNAQINTSRLGFISNGIFSFCLTLTIQDRGAVTLGGYVMDSYDKEQEKRVGTAYGMNLIMRILEVVGVDTWEELEGKYIRIKNTKLGDRVSAIGNLMKEEWIDFDTFGKELL